MTALALALVPLVWWILRDQPTDVGTTPYGAGPGWVPAPVTETRGAARVDLETLRESARSRAFWILFVTFWICGWSTNGLSSTSSAPSPAAG